MYREINNIMLLILLNIYAANYDYTIIIIGQRKS